MIDLANTINSEKVKKGNISIYWLGGAGFILKSADLLLGIDLYLSDFYYEENNCFKMFIMPPLEPESIELDYLIATHEHPDHFDIGSLEGLIKINSKTKIIGPGSVIKMSKEKGVKDERLIQLDRDQSKVLNGLKISAVFADHGNMSPDGTGMVLTFEGKTIYFVGDTCFRPDLPDLIKISDKVDLLVVPINGRYGNPDPKDASYIAQWIKPKIVVPCHFWMFKEHGGDPSSFEDICKKQNPDVDVKVMTIGQKIEI